jgi:tetratricopeptide (TPR) repeat protein
MSDSALGAGEVVAGRFEIVGPGGVGGMAVVFRAKDRTNGRVVALKVLSQSKEEKRFVAEAETLASVKSPHVVGYVAHGMHGGMPYLAMDWLDGEDLDARLRRGPLPVGVAVDLVMRVAMGLGAAHRLGIVHRDVKPDNIILLDRDPATPILVDFGVARLPGRRFTAPGLVLGTPGFFAPEQARAESSLDPRADVFALASVLFECITGVPLWDGESVLAILTKILFVPAPRLDAGRGDVPPALADLVQRMLEKSPDHRPSDGQAVADALLAIDLRDTSMTPLEPRAVEPRPQRSIGQGGRSVASVLVARLPQGALTPVLSRRVRDMGQRFGATFEELADGSLAALVAGQRAATDLAVIATRLALAVRKALPVRAIGVATGRTALGDRSELGGVIARAAALASNDTARSLVNVDPTTAGLLGERFTLVASGDGVAVSGEERDGTEASTALRGRKGELALGAARFAACVAEPSARALVLVGEAGIGKTALARALLHTMVDHASLPTVVSARGEPLYESAPFALVAELLRHAIGIGASPDVTSLDTVATWIGARMDGAEASHAVSVVAEVLRLGGGEKSLLSAQSFGGHGSLADRLHEALVGLFRAECRGVPVIFSVDDLQFADAPSLGALETLLRRLEGEPFFVLATARPDVLERAPTLFAAPHVQTLPVLPLPDAECAAWVREVLGDRASDGRVNELVLRSEGSPFVLGELLRAARSGSRGTPRAALAAVHARLESLPPDLLLALRGASVSGIVDEGDVAHVTGLTTAAAALEALVAEDVLVRAPSAGAMRYAFKNRLLQEVAYGMLTAADRSLAHSLAGGRAEARGDAAAIVAEHFMRAGALERAALSLARAAREALAANDVASAAAFAERGLATEPALTVRADLYASLAEARLWQGDPRAGKEAAERTFAALREAGAEKGSLAAASALSVLLTAYGRLGEVDALESLASDAVLFDATSETAPVLAHALARGGMNLVFMGRFAAGRSLIAQLRELAQAFPDRTVEARWAQSESVLAHYDGNLAGHFAWAERALAIFDALGDRRTAAVLRTNVGDALRVAGELEKAEVQLRAALEITRALGIGSVEGPVRANLGATLARLGQHEEAIAHLSAVLSMFEKASDRRLASSAAMYLGEVYVDRGEAALAEAPIETGLGYAEPGTPLRPPLLALRSRARLLAGQKEDALRDAESAMEELAALSQLEEDEIAIHEAFAAALLANGHEARARAACEAALARLAEMTSKLGDEGLKTSFTTNVPAHRRLSALAARLGLPAS